MTARPARREAGGRCVSPCMVASRGVDLACVCRRATTSWSTCDRKTVRPWPLIGCLASGSCERRRGPWRVCAVADHAPQPHSGSARCTPRPDGAQRLKSVNRCETGRSGSLCGGSCCAGHVLARLCSQTGRTTCRRSLVGTSVSIAGCRVRRPAGRPWRLPCAQCRISLGGRPIRRRLPRRALLRGGPSRGADGLVVAGPPPASIAALAWAVARTESAQVLCLCCGVLAHARSATAGGQCRPREALPGPRVAALTGGSFDPSMPCRAAVSPRARLTPGMSCDQGTGCAATGLRIRRELRKCVTGRRAGRSAQIPQLPTTGFRRGTESRSAVPWEGRRPLHQAGTDGSNAATLGRLSPSHAATCPR